MKQIIRDYFTFNKRERNGVFVLLCIIGLQLLYLNISSSFSLREPLDLSASAKEIAAFEASITFDTLKQDPFQHRRKAAAEKPPAERFDFDPNGLPEADWRRLGLSDKQIRMIKNYETKGGKFRKKEDVKKLYCISPELFLSLEPFIRIEDPAPEAAAMERLSRAEKKDAPVKVRPLLLDLNTCDSAQLTGIRGIGPFFAKAIIKYRKELGGYLYKEQLMEIWKFDQAKYESVERSLTLDPAAVRKININTCTAEELRHPYLSRSAAQGIVNYRRHHGRFKTIEEIKSTDLVNEETLRKIANYLTVE